MLLALALAALVAPAPAATPAPPAAAPAAAPDPAKSPAIVAYEAAVAQATATVRAALPRFSTCALAGADRVLVKVDLKARSATTVKAGGGAAPGASCVQSVAVDLFARTPPKAGVEAAFVLATAGGVKLDGDVALYGALPTDAIEAGMRGVLDRVAQCYIVGVGETPGLAGQVTVAFTVLPDGHAYGPTLKRTELYHPTVEDCVLRQVATATFRPPDGGGIVRVTYPFTFNEQ